jgi:hypothetical protein
MRYQKRSSTEPEAGMFEILAGVAVLAVVISLGALVWCAFSEDFTRQALVHFGRLGAR